MPKASLLVVFLTAFLSSCDQEIEWKRVSQENAGFAIDFPIENDNHPIIINDIFNDKQFIKSFKVNYNNALFATYFIPLDLPISTLQCQSDANWYHQKTVTNFLQGKLQNNSLNLQSKFSLHTYPSIDTTLYLSSSNSIVIKSRLVQDKVYLLLTQNATEQIKNYFFDSFRIRNKTKAQEYYNWENCCYLAMTAQKDTLNQGESYSGKVWLAYHKLYGKSDAFPPLIPKVKSINCWLNSQQGKEIIISPVGDTSYYSFRSNAKKELNTKDTYFKDQCICKLTVDFIKDTLDQSQVFSKELWGSRDIWIKKEINH